MINVIPVTPPSAKSLGIFKIDETKTIDNSFPRTIKAISRTVRHEKKDRILFPPVLNLTSTNLAARNLALNNHEQVDPLSRQVRFSFAKCERKG